MIIIKKYILSLRANMILQQKKVGLQQDLKRTYKMITIEKRLSMKDCFSWINQFLMINHRENLKEVPRQNIERSVHLSLKQRDSEIISRFDRIKVNYLKNFRRKWSWIQLERKLALINLSFQKTSRLNYWWVRNKATSINILSFCFQVHLRIL